MRPGERDHPAVRVPELEVVISAVKPAGRRWARPLKRGSETDLPGQSSASFEFPGPHVAVDSHGDATVVWQAKGRTALIAEASERRASGRWQKAPVSKTPALTPHVAMDASGNATVVWVGPRGSIVAAAKSLSARNWSAAKTLARARPDVNPPQVAMDSGGEAVATRSGNPVQAAVRRGRNGSWQRPVKLGFGGVSQAALDPLGRAIVAWQRPTGRSTVIDAAIYVP